MATRCRHYAQHFANTNIPRIASTGGYLTGARWPRASKAGGGGACISTTLGIAGNLLRACSLDFQTLQSGRDLRARHEQTPAESGTMVFNHHDDRSLIDGQMGRCETPGIRAAYRRWRRSQRSARSCHCHRRSWRHGLDSHGPDHHWRSVPSNRAGTRGYGTIDNNSLPSPDGVGRSLRSRPVPRIGL